MKWLVGMTVSVYCGAGLLGLWYFWADKNQRPAVFFSFLQSVATIALLLLTYLYVRATQEQLADQNRPPKICITRYYYPETDPFTVNFQIEIANPSVRATSIGIKSIRMGGATAREAHFEIEQTRKERITIQARDLINVILKAQNFTPPGPIMLGLKTKAILEFDDVFHGLLPVMIEV